MTDDDPKDPKVKALVERDQSQPLDQFVDPATAAQLERWFGLPSFAQVEAGEVELVESEDPEVVAVRERRKRIAEEINPVLLAEIEHRLTPPDDLIKFSATIEPLEAKIALFDPSYFESRSSIAEERIYDQPEDIHEAIKENTPQALLRDLHRLEVDFDQPSDGFTNMEDEPPPEPLLVDVAAQVERIMTTRFRFVPTAALEVTRLLDESRNEIQRSWVDIAKNGRLYNRRVSE
jgi:hypothetical protein